MGRSVGQFFLPGRAAASVLQAATEFAASRGMKVVQAIPGSFVFAKGSKWWTWRRLLRIAASDVPGGAQAHVEAWAETFLIPELSAKPGAFIGLVPRKVMFALASDFLTGLGIYGGQAVLRHY